MGNTEFIFPIGWKPLKGKECFSIISSASLSALIEDENGDVLYLKVDDFNNPKNLNNINDSKIKVKTQEKENGVVPIGAIIVSKRGEAIRKNRVKITNHKAYLDPNLMAIKIFEEHNNVFFKYLIEQMNLQRFLEDSAIPQLNNKDFYPRNFIIPEKQTEQTAIASILSKVDEAIEATQNSIKSAEKLKKALMQNLLSGKLKPDGTWRKDDDFYVDEKFGEVPNGWNVKKVKDCFDFYPTASYSRSQLNENGEVNYIHYGDIHTKFDRILDIDKQDLPFIPNDLRKKYKLLKDGDLVISDASEDWEGVGKSIELINIRDKKIISGLHTLHLRPKSDDFIQGIKGYILNIHKVSIGIKRLATGMKVYGISKPNLGRVYLPIPTEPEQRLIKKTLDECSDDIFEKQTKTKTLQRLKKSLMQNLLTGKVRLPQEFIKQFESGRSGNRTQQEN